MRQYTRWINDQETPDSVSYSIVSGSRTLVSHLVLLVPGSLVASKGKLHYENINGICI